eukprot:TRINITY_DN13244_c0_g1_i1.p1 TRINITY_DN13244_c0_g1~~TRINITY_DN13244_c0_g1_i1.p1  ORF type:complete len:406 (-),score=73.42 TRINITY_DN13244_c0_g1_i1:42-1259(-)
MIRKLLCCAACLAARGREPVDSEFQEDVYEDVTAKEADFADSFWGLFTARKIVHIEDSKPKDWEILDGPKLLEHSCFADESASRLWKNDTVVFCGCCTDHLIGDPRSQAALLYMGQKELGPAFKRDLAGTTKQVGLVPVWSLGGRIPAVLCDRGRFVCHCEDPVWEWAEFEHACRRGQTCRPPEPIEEEASVGYSEEPEEDADVDSAVDSNDSEGDDQDTKNDTNDTNGSDISEENGSEISEDSKNDTDGSENSKKSSEAASLLQDLDTVEDIPDCAAQAESGSAHARFPLGSAFCEDFSVHNCQQTYVVTHLGVHHWCEVDEKMFRHCGANLVSVKDAQRVTDEAQSWAIQNFYRPDLGWKVETTDFTTRVVEHPLPEPDVFEQHVQKRMDAQSTAEILKKMSE